MGGIYALERLAIDSPRDQSSIVNVLSAFIRSSAPLPAANKTCPNNVTLDVQAALTVLGRRNTVYDGGATVDLDNTCLNHAGLIGAHFDHANLNFTNLFGAYLNNAHLVGAHFDDGSLYAADLRGAYLGRDDLTVVTICNAKLDKIHTTAGFRIPPPQNRCR